MASGGGSNSPWLVKISVRNANFTKSFATMGKMDPFVEVTLGKRSIGTVPPAYAQDLHPVWDFSFDAQEFDLGAELQFKAIHKHSWTRKDVTIGYGKLNLTAAAVGKGGSEQTIQMLKKEENTGTMTVGLKFIAASQVASPATFAAPTATAQIQSSVSQASLASSIPATNNTMASSLSGPTDTVKTQQSAASTVPRVIPSRTMSVRENDEQRNALISRQWWEIDMNLKKNRRVINTKGCGALAKQHKIACGSATVCCAGGIGAAVWGLLLCF
eukprot:TRINITY_DN7691_c0_g1_i1.p1 TRINITY_DN7691_c0_g1~~TRINITY_DN7691_c0_g1_i1.p1  ORF type:complete len:272 (-),score=42.00 TRINITY_DN7691_c0_g1_i1:36-851(-)